MITVNLGQIGIFKTDLSNAADAGALGAASVLSQSLLGLGIRSDMMCGFAIGCACMIAIDLLFLGEIGLVAAPATFVAFVASQLVDYFQAFGDAKMAWSNAKKTALQYAFQNAGVDEPRPKFEDFLIYGYGVDPASLDQETVKERYDEYLSGVNSAGDLLNPNTIGQYTKSGFSRFMEHAETGYWHFGEILPSRFSPAVITSGYGWENQVTSNDGLRYNSFDKPDPAKGSNYQLYDNWIETQVDGSIIYLIDLYQFPWQQEVAAALATYTAAVNFPIYLAKYGGIPILGWIIALVLTAITWVVTYFLITGISFGLTLPDASEQLEDNYITVRVRRHKREQDLGLWKFRYTPTTSDYIEARASSHVFREEDDTTIDPAFIGELIEILKSGIVFADDWTLFELDRHLFETGLTQTR